jgi:hypothetical protein
MNKIKLSKLKPECNIVFGSKNELACAEMLLYRIYESKRLPKRNIALLDNKNYEIEIDVKKENIIKTQVCNVCGRDVGIEAERCPVDEPINEPDWYENHLVLHYYVASIL